MNDSRNVILAIVLSIAVLFGWQYFVAGPAADRAAHEAQLQQQQQARVEAQKAAATAPGAVAPEPNSGASFKTRDEAIAATPRLKIDTPSLIGSIDLAGGRLDDLELKKYKVDLSENSPIVTLLTPASAPDSYFVEQGWVASGANVKLPDANTVWKVEGGTTALTSTTPVTLSYDNGQGLVFHRQFTVDDNYLFTVTQTVDNKTNAPVTLYPYSQVTRHGTPEAQNTFILHEGAVGILGDKNLVTYKYQDLQKDQQQDIQSNGGWLGFTDKYWAATVIPDPKAAISARFSWSKPLDTDVYKASFVDQAPLTVAAGQSASNKSYIFAGAKVEQIISGYQSQYGFDRFDFMIDWGWFSFLTHPMFRLIQLLHGLLGNFGLAILAVTVIIKLVFFPLASRSFASMAAMRKMQPELKALQEKYKDDRAALQQATMELYKKAKINPLAGCWPVLIQIPVFYSLYTVLFITIEMRHAPFFGWIQDLAAPDPTNIFTLFGLLHYDPTAIPVFGHFLAIGVWPLIMGCTMWLQMKLNPPPPDPTQAMIFQFMPVIFTFTLGTFPAGLVIYYAWNNTLTLIQQYIIMKRHGVEVNLFGNILASFRRTPKPEGN
ncbi:MAG TPA: membrane protein insertase YidC [Devosiaceae bacterium]|nr:membrane protein insertase YidC [Devosiaceae bacterium]